MGIANIAQAGAKRTWARAEFTWPPRSRRKSAEIRFRWSVDFCKRVSATYNTIDMHAMAQWVIEAMPGGEHARHGSSDDHEGRLMRGTASAVQGPLHSSTED